MRFDDRLSTVLGLSAEAPRDRAVQWRQLVELVARGAGGSDAALLDRALQRISALSSEVPDAVRASAARAIAGPALPMRLLLLFLDRTEIAAPLLAAAELDAEGWRQVRDAASPDVQELIDSLRPAREALKDRPRPARPAAKPPPEPSSPRPASAPEEAPGLFRWECGPTGEIDWVEGVPRAALIGRSVADDFQQRFAARLPIDDEPLVLAEEGLLAGEWKWTGTPTFFPDTGRFAGYRGEARRGSGKPGAAELAGVSAAARLDADRLRELIHELRTPLNAIIGFGELIEGQIMGPAHRAYRDRAAEIVRQARRLLAAVDDLDLAAKLQSGRERAGEGAGVADVLAEVERSLQPMLGKHGVSLAFSGGARSERLAMELPLARRLVARCVDALAAGAAKGETLEIAVTREQATIAFRVALPESLRGSRPEQLFDPGFAAPGATGLGTGFALRLLRGLASIAGGGVEVTGETLSLKLPAAGD